MIKNVYWSARKVRLILVRFYLNLSFLNSFSKNDRIRNFMKIRPMGAELFYADRRTDMKKLIFFFAIVRPLLKKTETSHISRLY
jgi:hypothetical protein